MKSLALIIGLLALTCTIAAQEAPVYGPVSIVAASSSEDGMVIARQLARETSAVLREERQVRVDEGEPLPLGPVTDEELLKAAGVRVNWVAVVNVDAAPSGRAVYDLQVAHVVAAKIVSRVSAWVGTLPTAAGNVGAAITREARAVAHEIATYVSQRQIVRVVLRLLTHPGNADYTVGASDVSHTDADGTGLWDHTLPVGRTVLRVMKPGYTDAAISIVVPVPVDGQPYVPLSETVDLRR